MIVNIEQFYSDVQTVIEKLNVFFREVGLAGLVQADHICFKCESIEEFEKMRALFEINSAYVFQSIISQRRISVIKFVQPIETLIGPIAVLELSDQKPDGSQKSGFDHIEIYPIGRSVEDIVVFLEQKGIMIEKESKAHHTTWDFFVDGFKIRIEDGLLIEKIKKDEMV